MTQNAQPDAKPVFGTHGNSLYFHTELGIADLVREIRSRLALLPQHVDFLVMAGPARVGTTVLQVLASQLPGVFCAEFQPFKYMLRHGIEADSFTYDQFHINGLPGTIVLKETIGPEREIECKLDPVEILVQAGIHPQRIRALYILRDPLTAYHSWKKFVTTRPQCYEWTQSTIVNAYERDRRRLKSCVPFFYEALEHNDPAVLVRMFQTLGFQEIENNPQLLFQEDAIRSKNRWNEATKNYYWDNVVAPMVGKGSFQFQVRPTPELPPGEAQEMQKFVPAFEAWKRMSAEILSL